MKTAPASLLPGPLSRAVFILTFVLLGLSGTLRAQDVLIQPTDITSSTSGSDVFPASQLINGSGLSGTPTLANLGTHSTNDGNTLWATNAFAPDYFANGGSSTVVLTCTLPRSFLVSGLVYWGYNGNYSEAKSFTVEFSTDGVNFSGAANVTQLSVTGTSGVHLPFPGGAHTATHVRLTITDNHYGTGGVTNQGGDRVGLGEIRFAGSLPTQDIVNNLSAAFAGNDNFGDTSKVSAHAFTVGSEAQRLESITVRVDNGSGAVVGRVARVKLWSSGSGVPSTVQEDLGTFSFSNPNAANYTIVSTEKPLLVPGLTYWVSLQMVSGAAMNWTVTSDASSTGTGTLPTSRAVSTNGGTTWTSNVNGNRHLLAVAGASPYLVTNTNDSGLGSLRQALQNAATIAGPHTITFDSSLSGQSIALQNGAPDSGSGASAIYVTSTDAITIDASSLPGGITLTRPAGAGGDGYRGLRISAASNVTLRGLTLSGFVGQATHSGGAVLNQGTLTLEKCTLSGNTADGTGGGAIYNAGGAATLTQCTLSGNAAPNGNGGAIVHSPAAAATFTLTHCTVSGNSAGANGGGIYNSGSNATLTLSRSIVAGNTLIAGSSSDIRNVGGTVTSGGRNLIGNNSTVASVFPAGAPNANGEFAGTSTTPLDAQISALGSYGGPTQTRVPLPGSPAIDAATGSSITTDQRGFPIQDGDGNGSVLADIGAAERLGAFVVVNTNDSGPGSLRQAIADAATQPGPDSITFAPGLSGGVISLASPITAGDAGGVTVDASMLPGGLTLDDGVATTYRLMLVQSGSISLRAITLANGGGAGFFNAGGGAIHVQTGSSLTLERCTFTGNTGNAGGGAISNNGTLSATHCTFAGNHVLSGSSESGGGGALANSGTATLTHCTLADNSSTPYGGGAVSAFGVSLTLSNTIVAGNNASSGPDIFHGAGTITTTGVNLLSNLAGSGLSVGSSVIVGAPNLAPMGNYGGPTKTMPPLPGSPAIDAAVGSSISTDQRGFPIQDGDGNGSILPDIGAVEANVPIVVQNTGNSGPGSLRQAIADAATQSGPDSITFAPGLSGQSIALTGVADATYGASALTVGGGGNVTLDASALPGGLTLTRPAGASGNDYRAFLVASGSSLTLRGLTLTGFTGPSGYSGGAIFNGGTLTLTQCTLSGNSATNSGGAIYNGLTLTLTNSIVAGNTRNGVEDNISGPIDTSNGVNLTSGDPLLAPLGNYGGPRRRCPHCPAARLLTRPAARRPPLSPPTSAAAASPACWMPMPRRARSWTSARWRRRSPSISASSSPCSHRAPTPASSPAG